MQWSDISFAPSARTLRQFAGLWIVFWGGMACWQGLMHERWVAAACLAVLAVSVGSLGLWRPSIIRPIFVSWMVVAFPIGWVISHVLLGLIFYLVFTPVSLIFRLIGRDQLRRLPHPELDTYWELKPVSTDVHGYFRQY